MWSPTQRHTWARDFKMDKVRERNQRAEKDGAADDKWEKVKDTLQCPSIVWTNLSYQISQNNLDCIFFVIV